MPSPHALIGELYTYHPDHNNPEGISSVIVEVKELKNYLGQKKTVVILKNGEEIPAENIYLENFDVNIHEAKLSSFDCKNCPMICEVIPFHKEFVAPASKRAWKRTKYDFHAGYNRACKDIEKRMIKAMQ